MIAIEQLRYVRLGTANLAAAADFATGILGLELVEASDEQATFKSDFRDHTLAFVSDPTRAQSIGLEVRDPETLVRAADALSAQGYDITPGNPETAAKRKVKSFLTFKDETGLAIELVVRPLHSGCRYFPSRDAGITGLAAVALRSPAIARSESLWTKVLGGRVSDWIGDAAYVRLDAVHHRVALHPFTSGGVLAVEFGVESVDHLMQASYFLQDKQVRIVHGPGRRPASGQIFLTFAGPDGVLFSYVTDGEQIKEGSHHPRQFARRAQSFCAWGCRSEVPEFHCNNDNGISTGART